MRLEEHCERSLKLFGKEYKEIHLWLDEFSSKYPKAERYKHRKYRHHKEGVEEVRIIFGDIGALVAEDHIRSDNDGMLPYRTDYNIPEYEG